MNLGRVLDSGEGAVTYLGKEVTPEVGVHSSAAGHVWQEGDEPLHLVQHRVGVGHVLPVLVRGPAPSFHRSPNLLLNLFWKEQTKGMCPSKEANSLLGFGLGKKKNIFPEFGERERILKAAVWICLIQACGCIVSSASCSDLHSRSLLASQRGYFIVTLIST